ncbi:hypothetical protein M426DRAFT_62199 [Hypoxylon sp. CI-4A]|nr:hypothetical protein M426DRAFT_62199 [Hypoxylon sp. CI-4A]
MEALGQLHEKQKIIFDTIIKLNEHGVSHNLNGLRIVVAGDKYSGKSSVLKAIQGLSFPQDSIDTTRCATEFIFRATSVPSLEVVIQPSLTLKEERIYRFDYKESHGPDISKAVELAKAKLLDGKSGVSDGILKIITSGPNVPHSTLIDLPGFPDPGDENNTSSRAIVQRFFNWYTAGENSIVLAIIPAQGDMTMDSILSKLKPYYTLKHRTLGVITKPDVLEPGSLSEDHLISLTQVKNGWERFSLGLHVVYNPNRAVGDLSGVKEADFFKSGNWAKVSLNDIGAEALRIKLASLLQEHAKNNLNNVIKDTERVISSSMVQLKQLGEPISSPKEQRMHLAKIAFQFNTICLQAMEGNYEDKFFGDFLLGMEAFPKNNSRIKKLRALLHDFNQVFSYVLETKGSKRAILPSGSGTPQLGPTISNTGNPLPKHLQVLAEQYDFKEPEKVTLEGISAELGALLPIYQGNEYLGTSNDRLAMKLFQDKAQPWEAIAQCHVRLMLTITREFVDKLVEYITGKNENARSVIISQLVTPFFEQKSKTLESKLQELLLHYKDSRSQPLNTGFRASFAQRQQLNIPAGVMQNTTATQPTPFPWNAGKELAKMGPSLSETETIASGLVDKAEAYYEASLGVFTNNVIILAIENCLIKDLPSIITTEMFNEMDDSQVDKLVSQSPEILEESKKLQEKQCALQEGLQVLDKFRAETANRESIVTRRI